MGLIGGQSYDRRRRADTELQASIDTGYATDPGSRPTNEDRATVSAFWAVISDGAGGHAGGDIAAQLAVEVVASRLHRTAGDADHALVVDALVEANAAIRSRRRADPERANMAATLAIVACTSFRPAASRWVVTNVGDSPVWHWSGGRLARLSEEHNIATELVKAGMLSAESSRGHPGRHTITRALGLADEVAPHITDAVLHCGERLVLASDGVEILTEAEISATIARHERALGTAQGLVAAALSAGATDNVTVAVVRFAPLEAGGPNLATRARPERVR
jgi:serine/threonine protein phosphatase PrpC